MNPTKYYDKEGRKVLERFEWEVLFENDEYRIVKHDLFPSGLFVSTVWLGFSTNGYGTDIFETMAFSQNDGGEELDRDRTGTLDQAIEGHARMIERWINVCPTTYLKRLERKYRKERGEKRLTRREQRLIDTIILNEIWEAEENHD